MKNEKQCQLYFDFLRFCIGSAKEIPSTVSIGECRIVCLDKVSYLCTMILIFSNYGTRQKTIKQQAKVRRGCNR